MGGGLLPTIGPFSPLHGRGHRRRLAAGACHSGEDHVPLLAGWACCVELMLLMLPLLLVLQLRRAGWLLMEE